MNQITMAYVRRRRLWAHLTAHRDEGLNARQLSAQLDYPPGTMLARDLDALEGLGYVRRTGVAVYPYDVRVLFLAPARWHQ